MKISSDDHLAQMRRLNQLAASVQQFSITCKKLKSYALAQKCDDLIAGINAEMELSEQEVLDRFMSGAA